MWLLYIALPIVVIAIVGSIVSGGIFSIVLIPIAIIAVIAAVWGLALARAGSVPGAQRRPRAETGPRGAGLPRSFARSPATADDSPEALADTRRELQ